MGLVMPKCYGATHPSHVKDTDILVICDITTETSVKKEEIESLVSKWKN